MPNTELEDLPKVRGFVNPLMIVQAYEKLDPFFFGVKPSESAILSMLIEECAENRNDAITIAEARRRLLNLVADFRRMAELLGKPATSANAKPGESISFVLKSAPPKAKRKKSL